MSYDLKIDETEWKDLPTHMDTAKRYVPPHLRTTAAAPATVPDILGATTHRTADRPQRARWQPQINTAGFYGSFDETRPSTTATPTGINFDKYDKIPVEVKDADATAAPIAPIVEFAIPNKTVAENVVAAGYKKPTPVQKYSIPIGLAGRDIMACAQTGSGKTAGFLLPVISCMLTATRTTRQSNQPLALILVPTRELAIQTYDEAKKFCFKTGIRPIVVYGGVDRVPQLREIERGIDILIATPGRLLDFMSTGRISLSVVQYLVLDEADRMLDMGFEPQIRDVVSRLPAIAERQTFMFSATFPPTIRRLASDFMKPYVFITVGTVGSPARDIEQLFEWVDDYSKTTHLLSLLEGQLADKERILIFVATKRTADQLQFELCRADRVATSIHGDRVQVEREEALNAFKSGEIPILVATDVASRGLDIAGVDVVVNYDMPTNIDDYVHRIGRTGRAGHAGQAISFFNDNHRAIGGQLVKLLTENNVAVPDFLRGSVGR